MMRTALRDRWMDVKILPLITALVLAIASGCARRETPVDTGPRTQVLHIGNQSEPADLDPHLATGLPEFNIIAGLMEGLVTEPGRDGAPPAPATASAWTVSPDERTYTFTIRPEARWSTGEPVTAADFVFSYKRILSPAMACPYAYMFFCITNAQAFHDGRVSDFATVGVKAPDARRLEIRLERPVPYFLAMLSHHAWFPVHPPTITRFNAMQRGTSEWTRPGNFVGNGPFVLSAWEPGDHIGIVRNTNYWDAAAVLLSGVRFDAIGDYQIEERAYRAGQLHITGTVPIDRIEHYRTNNPDVLHIEPWLGTYFYSFNTRRPPLSDARVRRALSLAIDRGQIVSYITRAGETAAARFTPEMPGYTPAYMLRTDIEEARRQLAAAGFPEGRGFPRLELLYNTSDVHARIAQAIQQMWQTNLGIDSQLVNMEWKVYLAAMQTGQYDIARASWIADYVDPTTFLDLLLTGAGNNRSGWSNAAYDALMARARETADPAGRMRLLGEAETLLLDEAPIMPIYYYRSKSLVHPSVQGWSPTLLNHFSYKNVRLAAPTAGPGR